MTTVLEDIQLLMKLGFVTDYCSEYGEPGYGSIMNPESFIVLGNYWCRDENCDYDHLNYDGSGKMTHGIEFHYPEMFERFEEENVELEWYDEWTIVDDKAYRTTADSYQWQTSVVYSDDGEPITINDPIDVWIEWAVNCPSRCLMSKVADKEELKELGFIELECGLENGWHPGQNDNPEKITEMIRENTGYDDWELEILFVLSEVSQFYVGFCVFTREVN